MQLGEKFVYVFDFDRQAAAPRGTRPYRRHGVAEFTHG